MGKTLRTVSAIFLLSIFIVSAMLCTAPAFGLSATQGQTLAEVPQMPEITEGYVLSKHSDYRTDDRDYVRGDMLYVWAWSSRVNPYDVEKHYCQLKLDEYVHEFFLNYDQNMTLQYSYTGSFNLSRLEKTGDWDVQTFLKTKPPKPITFNPPNDMIHVSAEAPLTHKLSIPSSPISEVPFTLNGMNRTTPFSSVLDEGSYTIVMPLTVTVDAKVYNFVDWDDGTTSPIRSMDLTKDTAITAYYTPSTPIPSVPPPLIPTELWQMAIGSLTVFGATAYVLLWRRQRHVRREIKEMEYRTTIEGVRLEAMLQELDNLLQKGLISRERYETMREEIEDELTRIRSLKS